jgi:D-lactate dehydrogenase
MKIAVFSTYQYDEEYFSRFNTGHELTFYTAPLDSKTVNLSKDFECICIFVNDRVDADVLVELAQNGVKLIVLRCAGFNNVDLEKAKELGIVILRVPAYSPEAVAEHAMALILTLNRKTHKAYNRVREGNFSLEKLMGFNLHQRKVAVIGTGHIGQAFCRILKGFGCQIAAYDPFPNKELQALGVNYGTLAETLCDADIVSLHCPLNEDTMHMVNKETLKLFNKGAMLINTSRGALIQTADVIDALKHGRLGYLGIDVYEQEGQLFFNDHSEAVIADELITRLISFPNVLITSHQGFFTKEAMEQIATITYQNIDAFEQKSPLVNQVGI